MFFYYAKTNTKTANIPYIIENPLSASETIISLSARPTCFMRMRASARLTTTGVKNNAAQSIAIAMVFTGGKASGGTAIDCFCNARRPARYNSCVDILMIASSEDHSDRKKEIYNTI